MNERETIQTDAISAWVNNGHKGAVILPTGTGKTRVGVLATRYAKTALIVTSRKNLVKQWQDELDRWGSDCKVEIVVINTAVKKLGSSYDLLLVDEAHRSLSDQFVKLYDNVKYEKLLMLTATPPERPERVERLKSITEIVYQKSLEEILGKKIVSDIVVYNLAIESDQATQNKYRVFDRMFNQASIELAAFRQGNVGYRQYKSIFELASVLSKSSLDIPEVKLAKQYYFAMQKRKEVIYTSTAKIKPTLDIINKFPKRKFIVFTKSIKFAEEISDSIPGSICYHSKLSLKAREEILKKYKEGVFRVLVSVDALNEGMDVPEVDAAICVSGVSTNLINVQQQGRIIRFQEDKKAIFINLVLAGTQEEKWVDTKTQDLPFVSKINSINDIG